MTAAEAAGEYTVPDRIQNNVRRKSKRESAAETERNTRFLLSYCCLIVALPWTDDCSLRVSSSVWQSQFGYSQAQLSHNTKLRGRLTWLDSAWCCAVLFLLLRSKRSNSKSGADAKTDIRCGSFFSFHSRPSSRLPPDSRPLFLFYAA